MAGGSIVTNKLINAKVWDGTEWVAAKTPEVWAEISGGTMTTATIDSVDWQIHTFTASGNLTVTTAGLIEYLIVSGGGGGNGTGAAGGGGAGGGGYLRTGKTYLASGTTSVIVGAGGLGSVGSPLPSLANASSLGVIESAASGGGNLTTVNANIGANGGGGGNGLVGGGILSANGNVGGDGNASGGNKGGGGGGNGAAGGNADGTNAGNGGNGLEINFNGTPTYYGGGGGGGAASTAAGSAGTGGLGGGGNGAKSGDGSNGTNGIGGGGGGAGGTGSGNRTGGDGGDGIVIVRVRV
jgi:hypothetical protein